MDADRIAQAIKQHSLWIVQQPGIVGCDLSTDREGRPCLRVFASGADATIKLRIAERVDPVPVEFVESGPIRAEA